MGALRCISRSGLRLFITEDRALDNLVTWYTHSGLPSFSLIEPHGEIFFDGGGAVHIAEPSTHFQIDDTKFGIYLRHIPFFTDYLKHANDNDVVGCVKFCGFRCVYVLTNNTKDMIIAEMDRLYTENKRTIQDLEDRIASAMSSAGAIYLGPCSCLSGRPYAECCGKRQIMG